MWTHWTAAAVAGPPSPVLANSAGAGDRYRQAGRQVHAIDARPLVDQQAAGAVELDGGSIGEPQVGGGHRHALREAATREDLDDAVGRAHAVDARLGQVGDEQVAGGIDGDVGDARELGRERGTPGHGGPGQPGAGDERDLPGNHPVDAGAGGDVHRSRRIDRGGRATGERDLRHGYPAASGVAADRRDGLRRERANGDAEEEGERDETGTGQSDLRGKRRPDCKRGAGWRNHPLCPHRGGRLARYLAGGGAGGRVPMLPVPARARSLRVASDDGPQHAMGISESCRAKPAPRPVLLLLAFVNALKSFSHFDLSCGGAWHHCLRRVVDRALVRMPAVSQVSLCLGLCSCRALIPQFSIATVWRTPLYSAPTCQNSS